LEKTEIMRLTLADVLRNLGIKDIRATSDPGYAFEMLTERPADLVFPTGLRASTASLS